MIRALILDLDDTLYDERDYVLSGFRAVTSEIERRFPQTRPDHVFRDMVSELDMNGRGKVFDVALAAAGLAPDPELIAALVAYYRDHCPPIALWPGVEATLRDLRTRYCLAVVTDGNHLMQQRKAEALGLSDLVDATIFCWEHEAPKPDPKGYRLALDRLGAEPSEAVVIGDNPHHDMAAAHAIGARSIRVRSGRFAAQDDGAFPATATAQSFVEVPGLLQSSLFGDTP